MGISPVSLPAGMNSSWSVPHVTRATQQTFDFAVYGLAVISMSAQIPPPIRQPVSRDIFSKFEEFHRAIDLRDAKGLGAL